MGLQQAVYDSTSGFIFGVNGQWVHKFSATDGSLIASLRFSTTVGSVSTITAFGGNLYIGTAFTPSNDLSGFTPFNRDIYKVAAAAFNASVALGLTAHLSYSFPSRVNDYYAEGWHNLVNSGGKILGLSADGDLFTVDPTNVAGYTRQSFGLAADIAVDDVNGALWIADPASPDIWAAQINPLFSNDCFDTNGNLNSISGICYNQAQNKVYAVDGTFNLYGFGADLALPAYGNFHVSLFNLARINANPWRLKSVNNLAGNPLNGKVLVPTWADDAVVVWNPLTDAVDSVKTGFTAPFDIVSTPTRNFAVQSGLVGLRQIT